MLAIGLPLLLRVSIILCGARHTIAGVRAIVLESGALKVILGDTIGHASAHHIAYILVLGIHGVVHHHTLVTLLILHLGESLRHCQHAAMWDDNIRLLPVYV